MIKVLDFCFFWVLFFNVFLEKIEANDNSLCFFWVDFKHGKVVWVTLFLMTLLVVPFLYRSSLSPSETFFDSELAENRHSKTLYLGYIGEKARSSMNTSTMYTDQMWLQEDDHFMVVDAFTESEERLHALLEQADAVVLNFMVLQALDGGGFQGLLGIPFRPSKQKRTFLIDFIKYKCRGKVRGSLLGDLGDYIFDGKKSDRAFCLSVFTSVKGVYRSLWAWCTSWNWTC